MATNKSSPSLKNSQEQDFALFGQRLLPQSFYARDAAVVAKDLLGKIIRHHDVAVRITETEAYCFPYDSANHSFKGKTKRNAAMWGPPGHAYVYLCYGLHNMLNFVTNPENEAAAVLIRSCEPIFGLEIMTSRRRGVSTTSLLTGPGCVGQALGVDASFCHQALFEPNDLEVYDAEPVKNILVGPRVGIDYAEQKDRKALWRFADGDSRFLSKRATLRAQ